MDIEQVRKEYRRAPVMRLLVEDVYAVGLTNVVVEMQDQPSDHTRGGPRLRAEQATGHSLPAQEVRIKRLLESESFEVGGQGVGTRCGDKVLERSTHT